MARFQVVGADRDTGENVEIVVDATDDQDAVAKATRRGLLVAACGPLITEPASGTSSPMGGGGRACENCGKPFGKLGRGLD